jgi:hypothetical protein
MNKKFFLFVNYCIAAFLLYWICYPLDFNQLSESFHSVRLIPLLIAILIALFFKLVYFSWLWHMVFRLSLLNVDFQDIFYVNAYTLILKYVIPFKIAEIVRAVGLKLVSKIDLSLALGGTLYLKLITIISILVMFITTCMIKSEFHYFGYALLLLAVFFSMTQLIYFFPDNLSGFHLKQFKHCFTHIAISGKIKVLVVTFIMELGEVITLYFLMIAFALNIQMIDLIYFVSISKLVSMIPVSIQGIGIRESIAVSVFGISCAYADAFGIGFSLTVVYHILPAVTGLIISTYIRLLNDTKRLG